MQPLPMNDVKAEFASYLSRPEWGWNVVAHQTFDEHKCYITDTVCLRSWNSFLEYVGREANVVYGWMFGEHHKSGNPHWHAICKIEENLFGMPRRKMVWAHQYEKFGRFRLEPLRPDGNLMGDISTKTVSDGVSRYLVKYVAKEAFRGDATFDFGGFLGGKPADPKQICTAIGL